VLVQSGIQCSGNGYLSGIEWLLDAGIGFSPDKMLQTRIFSYADAHRYRIGVNYASLPVNHPHSEINTYARDDHMRFDGNFSGAVHYEPNSMGGPLEDRNSWSPR
jgi:catalase